MPDGLLDSLTQAEAIHLLRFITEMGKIDGHVPTSPRGASPYVFTDQVCHYAGWGCGSGFWKCA
jgi:hypothetical protein